MTSKRTVALRYFHYEAGITHSTAVVSTIVEAIHDGIDEEKVTAIIADINRSEQSALEAIPKRFQEAFSTGYYVGTKTALNKRRKELSTSGSKIIG